MTTATLSPEKYEALRRSGQVPDSELPEVLRCESFGHVYSLDWMSAYRDPVQAELVKKRLLRDVGTVCLECIRIRARACESAAWIEAGSVRTEIMGWVEKQQQVARVADEQAREQARLAPPRMPAVPPEPAHRPGSRLERALANAKERPFDLSGV